MFNFDWLAILAASVAVFIEGAIWFSPVLFGKPWAKATGVSMGGKGQSMTLSYFVQFLTGLLMTLVISMMLPYVWNDYPQGSGVVWFSVLVWIGFVFPIKFGDALWKGTKSSVLFIELFYQLLAILTASAVLCAFANGGWRMM